VPPLGPDPFLTRLRDVIGVLRVMAEVTPAPAVQRALDAVLAVHEVAERPRREKDLPVLLRRARRALREAIEAVPEQGLYLTGCLGRMPTMRGRR